MRLIFIGLFLLSTLPTYASEQTRVYQEEGCDHVLEKLVAYDLELYAKRQILAANEVFIPSSVKLLSVKDLDPGSYHVRRRTIFTANIFNKITQGLSQIIFSVITKGNLFCEDEILIEIKSASRMQ
ncbi:MAG: hypothetical protein KDD34_02910 [Bdellovibrionales bacterium]|nr:hypothetical protein [Bdellovibrionales bacterium]